MYFTCAEARVAVGEDDGDLETHDQDASADGFQAESSAVCDVTLNTAGDAIESTSAKPYCEVKDFVDGVGHAILGLDDPVSPNDGDIAPAQAWWDMLNNCEMINALYGDSASTADSCTEGTVVKADPPSRFDRAEGMYDNLDDATKTLVNDRWLWIYNEGGDEVDEWWDTASCAAMRVVVGVDNEPVSNAPDAASYCTMWDGLNADTDANTPGVQGTEAGQQRQATVFALGRAILGLSAQPSAQRWWDALTDPQRINVVYGNPLATEDADNDDATDETPVASAADRTKFQNDYVGLEDQSMVVREDLPTATTALLLRQGIDQNDAVNFNHDDDDGTTAEVPGHSVLAIVNAITNDIFDPPTPQMPGTSDQAVTEDDEFDPPYQSVGDWWEATGCQTMRLAVGDDNVSTDPAPEDDSNTPAVDESAVGIEPSIYCGHYPGSGNTPVISVETQAQVDKVGIALLNPISRIEPRYRIVTLGVGDVVTLSVDIYGLQNAKDDSLAASFDWT